MTIDSSFLIAMTLRLKFRHCDEGTVLSLSRGELTKKTLVSSSAVENKKRKHISTALDVTIDTLVSRTLVLSLSRGEVTEIVIADLQSVTLILNHFNSSPSSIKHLIFFKLITLRKCSIY